MYPESQCMVKHITSLNLKALSILFSQHSNFIYNIK